MRRRFFQEWRKLFLWNKTVGKKKGGMMKYPRFMLGMTSIFFVLLVVSSTMADTTYVSGIIDINTVWTPAGNPYIVIGDVLVDSAVTLDIEPGVEVRIDSAKQIMIEGTLNAIGTATDSIIITRNGTARWQRLWFKTASAGSLKYCRIEGAGNSAIFEILVSSLVIEYNTITNNSADCGGGICGDGSPTITGNTITNNSARSGGGIRSFGSPTITGNTITYNYADCGGGICSDGSPTITGNTITYNSAYWCGGGIYSWDSPTITGNTITYNSAFCHRGGGIRSFGSPTITGNTITYNYAYAGGGICSNGSATIKYNTITDSSGAAIYIFYSDLSDSILIDSNNLYQMRWYAYAVDNSSENDINARYNYWGTQSSDTIDMKIWDFYDNSTYGIVHYEPFLTEPVQGVEEKAKSKIQTSKLRLEVYPNPFRQKTTIHCEVNKTQNISLEIYDLSGRLVATINKGIWNGKNLNGKEVQSGIYFLKAKGYKPVRIVKLR